MKKAAVHNLGCKVNSYELDVMVQQLKDLGYEMVPFEEKADLYLVNTCSVTNIADRKSRQMLHRARKMNPDALVIAAGCYVETDRKKLEADPLVDLCIGNNRKGKLAEILQDYRQGQLSREETQVDLTDRPLFESMQLNVPGRTRADIKIQDGCSQFCTYCIIPYARGRIRSRDPEEILEEIRGLAADGVKEVVLTGIHISSYEKEKGLEPEEELLKLMTRIQLLAGIERIRLGSLEPRIITERFAAGICRLSKVCPHFHLSLQSGCNATLKRMNRHYTAEEYREGVEILRRYYDRPAITTDVIVGFPGETPEEFAVTEKFLRDISFYEIHVFKYSVRRGTAAEKMPNQCTDQTKAARSEVLLQMTREDAAAYRRSFVGEEEEVLLEEPVTADGAEYYAGHTMRYVEVLVPVAGHRSGETVKGTICSVTADGTRLLMRE
jgi:threonylcarbamoyladenosine tRNA methylthiotransferase MtaB